MRLKKISKKTADSFYKKFEHLGNCGLGIWHYGLYDKNELLSVVSFGTTCFDYSRGIIGEVAKRNNVKIIQLTRGGTKYNAPMNTPSKTIKLALSEIRKFLGDTMVIAYSDNNWNEVGTIYQACNFYYLGMTKPGGQCNYLINGKNVSGWIVRKTYGTRDMSKLSNMGLNVIRMPLTPKHRYIYINIPRIKKKFVCREMSHLCKLYPKRNDLKVGSMLEIRKKLNLG